MAGGIKDPVMVKSSLETESKPLLNQDKQLAREQWGQDPCGAEYVRDQEFGTREFFDSVEHHRYHEYAPWMPALMGFDQFAGKRLLEVGCGMGTDLLQFARGGAICTGVDLTPRSIEITRHRFGTYNQGGRFLITDGERLPFAAESFDVVYSNGVLHHTPDTSGAIEEIHRVLTPGGTAKVMLYHRNSFAYWIVIVLRHGIIGGELLRGRSPADIMSDLVEYSEHEGRPLVKVYSRRQVYDLFGLFKEVKVQVRQMARSDLRAVGRLIPQKLFSVMERSFGWNLVITARK